MDESTSHSLSYIYRAYNEGTINYSSHNIDHFEGHVSN